MAEGALVSNNQGATMKTASNLSFHCPILGETNYPIWSLKIKAIFKAHDLWDAIEPGTNVDAKKDNAAIAYLYQALPEDLILQVASCDKAKDIWDSIKVRHLGVERVMEARLQSLKTEFDVIKMKEGEKVDDFVTKLSGIASKSASLGSVIEEAVMVKKLLTSMPDSYIHMVATIEQLVELKTVKFQEVVGRLKAYEERVGMKTSKTSADQLLLSFEEWESKKRSMGRGRGSGQDYRGRGRGRGRFIGRGRGMSRGRGRRDNQTPENFKKDRTSLQCFRCDGYGHFSADCPTRKQEGQANLNQAAPVNRNNANPDEPALLMAVATEINKELIFVTEGNVFPTKYQTLGDGELMWYLDTGATNHMTGNRSLFSSLDTNVGGKVRFGDNSSVEIEGRGSILLNCKNGEQKLLTDILYIPHLKSNIFSIGQAEEGGCEFIIKEGMLFMYEPDGRLLMKVQRTANRLYKINLTIGTPVCLMSCISEPAWLWHARLGHVNFDTLKRLGSSKIVHGVPLLDNPKKLCEACLAGKHNRKSFPRQTEYRASYPLEQIYADLCGPITPATPGGNKYLLMFVDDHSRYMWPYLLKSKSDAFEHFRKFKAMVENQYKTKIRVLRTDRGGEFTSREFNEFCDFAGITRQLTNPYTPQQNGIVERRNRTVMNVTRSLLKAMSMPQVFWAEAVRHSIYILNRLPTRILKDRTPYEVLKGRKPSLEHLKVFGCIGHVKNPSQQIKKLDDRSTPMVHLGVEPGTKGYRMFDVKNQKIVISRDVIFDESRGWEWDSKSDPKTSQGGADFFIHVNDTDAVQEFPDGETQAANNNDDAEPQTPGFEQSPLEPETPSSEQSFKGRGPMLPSPATKVIYPTDPSVANEENFDNTPTRGWRDVEEIYDLLLTEVQELLVAEGEPNNYREACSRKEWKLAMEEEVASIERNKTWNLTTLPAGQRAIGLKWVYKLKRDANGEISRYKARLVAKGYVQQQGIDFEEVFAPVARLETVRFILALAAQRGWCVHHLDVKTAFLHGDLKEEVFVQQPEGFIKKGQEHLVYKLDKALYGLKQAPRAWNSKLDGVLKGYGFQRCKHEQAVYTNRTPTGSLLVGIYVDDLIVTGNNLEKILKFKKQMKDKFDMSDLGPLKYYLGLEVFQDQGGITIKQTGYAKKILQQSKMWDCNCTTFPMDPGLKLSKEEDEPEENVTEYRRVIGCLRYLTHTRPDLAFSVGYISRYMQSPKAIHHRAVKQILRYVKGTLDLGIHYPKGGNNTLLGFSDSSYSVDPDDGKGTTGVVFYFDDSPISWFSQKQPTVALSSCESEFMAATSAACQAIWLRGLLAEVTGRKEAQVVIKVDNKSAIALMKNPVFHGRSKHINTRFHYIRECVENDQIKVEYIRGEEQRADILTKALPRVKFVEMRDLLGLRRFQDM